MKRTENLPKKICDHTELLGSKYASFRQCKQIFWKSSRVVWLLTWHMLYSQGQTPHLDGFYVSDTDIVFFRNQLRPENYICCVKIFFSSHL